ncbi:uncharacterized protein wu:fa19b12 [Phyllopteryx taeniolatus]|uniref:uncharacterized protein wu:fa19b12 n=1 Tax=Phyllopteryx taeniolatus TaxID=161469 RepID=UPI002AD2A5A2|nr:uncharacterized protein wu:fa19b12 [Phyllopteryx taeniolatus]
MAKRHTDDTLFSQSPAKRKFRCLCRVVDLQLESMAAYGGVSPSRTLALLSGRCRKRPRSLEDSDVPQEAAPRCLKKTNPDAHDGSASHAQTCGLNREDLSSSTSRKRRRQESVQLETATAHLNDKTDADSEDCTFNSFQYWRAPLPQLDLSLLEETTEHCQIKHNSSVGNALDAMET